MRYKGVEYAILIGIKRGEWRVVVYPEKGLTLQQTVKGARQKAEQAAHRTIERLQRPERMQA